MVQRDLCAEFDVVCLHIPLLKGESFSALILNLSLPYEHTRILQHQNWKPAVLQWATYKSVMETCNPQQTEWAFQ